MKKYLNQIINADCLEVMKELPDKCIDMVLTDPPYGLKWKQSIELHGRKAIYGHRVETEKWDNVDRKFYEVLFTELDRIVKDNGSIIMFSNTEYITWLYEVGQENNFGYKATICWHKTNPIPQIRKKNYLSSIEFVSWLARYNEKKCDFTFNFKKQNEMHNFIEFPLCGGNERTSHPTQKPLEMIKQFVDIHSNEKDIILDPFLGSGTTAVACKQLNRNYIGIEISKEYCEIARRRLAQKQLF